MTISWTLPHGAIIKPTLLAFRLFFAPNTCQSAARWRVARDGSLKS
jgi:hypothetical protein